jgi:hypothetical protein
MADAVPQPSNTIYEVLFIDMTVWPTTDDGLRELIQNVNDAPQQGWQVTAAHELRLFMDALLSGRFDADGDGFPDMEIDSVYDGFTDYEYKGDHVPEGSAHATIAFFADPDRHSKIMCARMSIVTVSDDDLD